MSIQWYPGHMVVAKRHAEETLKTSDLVIEVLDARIPLSSQNPLIRDMRLFHQRPHLKILNKADLADATITQAWLKYFSQQPHTATLAISCSQKAQQSQKSSPQALIKSALALVPHRGSVLKPLRAMIMGVPNVGKSTLINRLLQQRVTKVGDEPAVTKRQQRLVLANNFLLIDTPGMMWPKIEHSDTAYKLAICHTIGKNALDEQDVALYLLGILLTQYPQHLTRRYGLECQHLDAYTALEAIAKQRGYHKQGWDLDRAAISVLTDYRHGVLGRMSLEVPEVKPPHD